MKKFLSKYRYQVILAAIVAVLFLVNRQHGTFLAGWDSLQTDLNPALGIKRAFFSVWEEYQSFGLVAGMAHAADLVRAVLVWIMSFVMPQNLIRYSFHFLMLLLGSLGAFTLMGFIGLTPAASFLGALFYLLNLGSIQIFYLPYESFSVFYGFLPWGIWSFMKVLLQVRGNKGNKMDWTLFFAINVLGTPSFYTQQLFIVYMAVLGLISLGVLIQRPHAGLLKKSVLLAFAIILINSFWILPQIYFLRDNLGWVSQNKASQISTEDTLYQNLEKGTLGNFAKLEGFYFDLSGVKSIPLFAPWKYHLSGWAGYLMYVFLGIAVVGLFYSLKNKKQPAMMLLLLLCAVALLNSAPPFSWINGVLRSVKIVNQMFRSPFTKFIILYSLVYSYFFAYGFMKVSERLKKITALPFILSFLIFMYSLPAFGGFMMSSEMQVKIPQDYFQVMEFFKNENKNKRIALLPDYTYWGWFFNKWGYNGSGFIWYGVEQPVVSRTFDGWSAKSESYFWEIKQAIEAENPVQFQNVLDKYRIDYLILDNSLIPVTSSYKSLALDRLDNLLVQDKNVLPVLRGENLSVFLVTHNANSEDFVSLLQSPKTIGPEVEVLTDDQAYKDNGDYIGDGALASVDMFYPFAGLTTQTGIQNKNWSIIEKDKSFDIESVLPFGTIESQLVSDKNQIVKFQGAGGLGEKQVSLKTQVIDGNLSAGFDKVLLKNFDLSKYNNDQEFSLPAKDLPQKYGYLVKIRSRNIKGEPLFFYITDETKKQSMIEEKLRNSTEYFIIPPKYQYGIGYNLAFQNKSFKNYPSVNQLEEVSIYLLPYDELKKTKFEFEDSLPQPEKDTAIAAKKLNYYTYEIGLESEGNAVITLDQAYDNGWLALSNGKFLKHVKVNNWSNGWQIDKNDKKVTLIFWPQYLEYLGFVLLGLCLLRILMIKNKHE